MHLRYPIITLLLASRKWMSCEMTVIAGKTATGNPTCLTTSRLLAMAPLAASREP